MRFKARSTLTTMRSLQLPQFKHPLDLTKGEIAFRRKSTNLSGERVPIPMGFYFFAIPVAVITVAVLAVCTIPARAQNSEPQICSQDAMDAERLDQRRAFRLTRAVGVAACFGA